LKLLNLSPSPPALESAKFIQSQIWKLGKVLRFRKISALWSAHFAPSSNENIQDGIMPAKNSRTALSGIGAPPSNTHRARVFSFRARYRPFCALCGNWGSFEIKSRWRPLQAPALRDRNFLSRPGPSRGEGDGMLKGGAGARAWCSSVILVAGVIAP